MGKFSIAGDSKRSTYVVGGEEKEAITQQYELSVTDEEKLLLKNAAKTLKTITSEFADEVAKDAPKVIKKEKVDRYIGSVNIPHIGGYKITADKEKDIRNMQTGEVTKGVGFSGTLKVSGQVVSKKHLSDAKELFKKALGK